MTTRQRAERIERLTAQLEQAAEDRRKATEGGWDPVTLRNVAKPVVMPRQWTAR